VVASTSLAPFDPHFSREIDRVKLRSTWSLILLAALSVAAAASCSTVVSSAVTSSTAGGSGATSATSATGHGGTGTGGSGASGGSSSQGGSTGAGGALPGACSACQTAGGQCTNGKCTISDNPGNVSTGTQGMLMAGGSSDPSFAWLYPYDKTVFPRGLAAPSLQFGGIAATAFYVRVSFPGMDYQGFYAADSVQGFAISPLDWTAITEAAGPTTAVKVDVTKIAGTEVAGPITETWTIAQGSLHGTIYYETYGSPILGGAGSVGLLKIQPGAAAPTPLKSGCGNVCHMASADGSTMVANAGSTTAFIASASYDLRTNASTLYASTTDQILTCGGIYPDGSFVVSATGYRTCLCDAPALYSTGSASSTQGGEKISAPGFDGVIDVTGTPAFSPDGTMLALNASGAAVSGGGATLSVMSFDHATFTFSNGRNVANHPGQTVAWPAFTPDGKWVLYHAGSNAQFETDNGAPGDVYFTSSASSASRPASTRSTATRAPARCTCPRWTPA
jgi:WD40-like Beta Propeller Repeat